MLTIFPLRKPNDSAFQFYELVTCLCFVFSKEKTSTIKNFTFSVFQILVSNDFGVPITSTYSCHGYWAFAQDCHSVQLTLKNSNTEFLELFDSSKKFFGPLNITHFFRQKNSRYLDISVGRTKLSDRWTIPVFLSNFRFNISVKIRKF